jgi:hypothetical protein
MEKREREDSIETSIKHLRRSGWPPEVLRIAHALLLSPSLAGQFSTQPAYITGLQPDKYPFDNPELQPAFLSTPSALVYGHVAGHEGQEARWPQRSDVFADTRAGSRNSEMNNSTVEDNLDNHLGTGDSALPGSSAGCLLVTHRASEFDKMPPSLQLACRKKPSHWKCHSCDQIYATAKSLERHAVAIGTDHHAFSCLRYDCRYTSLRYKALGRHFDGAHAVQKKHRCKFCDHRGFGRKDGLQVHMEKDHPQAWEDMKNSYPKYCSEPGCMHGENKKLYYTESQYLRHMRNDHGKRKWHCPAENCSRKGTKGYTRKCDLNSHILEYHPSLSGDIVTGDIEKSSS